MDKIFPIFEDYISKNINLKSDFSFLSFSSKKRKRLFSKGWWGGGLHVINWKNPQFLADKHISLGLLLYINVIWFLWKFYFYAIKHNCVWFQNKIKIVTTCQNSKKFSGTCHTYWNYWCPPRPPGIEGHPRLANFYEIASVNKLAGVLNASLSFVLLTWISRTFMNSSSERLFHITDTYESFSELPDISFKKWPYDKTCVKTFSELVYARKLVK